MDATASASQHDDPEALNAADLLSLSRIAMAGLLWLLKPTPRMLTTMMTAAAVSDVLDGRVARYLHQQRLRAHKDPGHVGQAGGRGAWLDPLCDKVFVASLLARASSAGLLSPTLASLVMTRDVLVGGLFFVYELIPGAREKLRLDLRARALGKATTALQFATVFAALARKPSRRGLALTTAAVGLAATVDYVRLGLRARAAKRG